MSSCPHFIAQQLSLCPSFCWQRSEAMAALQESVIRLWGEQGRGPTAGQHLFVKDLAPGALVSLNRWGVYQALRWAAGASFSRGLWWARGGSRLGVGLGIRDQP